MNLNITKRIPGSKRTTENTRKSKNRIELQNIAIERVKSVFEAGKIERVSLKLDKLIHVAHLGPHLSLPVTAFPSEQARRLCVLPKAMTRPAEVQINFVLGCSNLMLSHFHCKANVVSI